MFGERIKRLTNIAALLIFALAIGVALQAGIALASRIMPRIEVIEIHATDRAETADMTITDPHPAMPGRYQY
ncbi:hypothetical protein [Salinicola rhizosphaerae]|uniref:Uncharacterized protein n=1 Tax=Salinicola rhizosphaerae TaxID=1443141 RepID=A0ABQ3EC19_9GAMM|nr:hypothetical protein [Salinicola rhizosphaerae]GHB33084.1 hypothetical protein GCM10009038_35080 [Salinicola rhizosphaerae]